MWAGSSRKHARNGDVMESGDLSAEDSNTAAAFGHPKLNLAQDRAE